VEGQYDSSHKSRAAATSRRLTGTYHLLRQPSKQEKRKIPTCHGHWSLEDRPTLLTADGGAEGRSRVLDTRDHGR